MLTEVGTFLRQQFAKAQKKILDRDYVPTLSNSTITTFSWTLERIGSIELQHAGRKYKLSTETTVEIMKAVEQHFSSLTNIIIEI